MWVEGFAPILSSSTRVLILGSMPSQASLSAHQYYAHTRNAFWPIMQTLFNMAKDASYEDRVLALEQAGVAVWDVYAECFREGSLDSSIQLASATCNNFVELFSDYPHIHSVFFNGKAAQQAYIKNVIPQLSHDNHAYYVMPSTSPANAAMQFSEKLQKWRQLKEVLEHANSRAS